MRIGLNLRWAFSGFLVGGLLALFACGVEEKSPQTRHIGSENGFSSPLPSSLQKHRSEVGAWSAQVVVDGLLVIDLVVDLEADTVGGEIPSLAPGLHSFVINYYLNGVLVVTASTAVAIEPGAVTPVAWNSDAFVYPDEDNDGSTNLEEIQIFGPESNAWGNSAVRPVVSVKIDQGDVFLRVGERQAFTATVAQSVDTTVTWMVEEGGAGGSITSEGLYTTPASSGIFHVRATSKTDSSKTDTATVTVVRPGDLDTSFGNNGKAITTLPGQPGVDDDQSHALVIQGDGKLVTAGFSFSNLAEQWNFGLTRHNPNGILDVTFNGDGIINTAIQGARSKAYALALQGDKLIVAGSISRPGGLNDFALARFSSDGNLDPSFGINGKETTPIGQGAVQALVIVGNDKIVAAGYLNTATDGSVNNDFALVRYNFNGNLDTTFGVDGKVTTDLTFSNEEARAIIRQSDGKLIAAGFSSRSANEDFALVRYDESGNLDNSFGTGGRVTTAIGASNERGHAVALQTDNKIIIAGQSHNGANHDFALVRYNPDGTLDTTFGTGGKVTTSVGAGEDVANALVIQTDGKIVVAGYSHNGANYDFALVRYNPDGTLDTTFGAGGKVITPIGADNDTATALAIQTDGKIVVSGYFNNGTLTGGGEGVDNDFALVRYWP